MAPKRLNPIENPPAASSSDDDDEEVTSSEGEEETEEEASSEEEEEEKKEDPKTQTTPLTQKNPPSKKPEASAHTNDDDDESGETETDSDSDSDSDSPTPNVKPIATKSMEETMISRKPISKPSVSSPVKAKASSTKRPSESNQEPKDAKRLKKKDGEDDNATAAVEEVKKTGDDAKKQLFQRLFTEEDEIAVLKGMLDYSEKKGSDPLADMNAFYDFVKKSIHTDVTKAQLMDKIRRLKKKFENNAGKGKKGKDRTFSKVHDQEAFSLSKSIWGKDGISGKVESSAARSNGKAKPKPLTLALPASKAELPAELGEPLEVDDKSSKSLFDKSFGVGCLEEVLLNHGLDMIEGEKKAALEKKWRKLQISELELFLQRNELVKEHAQLILESLKSQDK